jgi:hypothetical protein
MFHEITQLELITQPRLITQPKLITQLELITQPRLIIQPKLITQLELITVANSEKFDRQCLSRIHSATRLIGRENHFGQKPDK